MRILVLHAQLGMLNGGGEHVTRNLMAQMVKRGHTITAVFTARLSKQYPYPLPSSFHAEPLPMLWQRTPGQNLLTRIGHTMHRAGLPDRHWRRVQEALRWRTIFFYNQRFHKICVQHLQQRWREFDFVYVHGDTPLAWETAQYIVTCLRLPGPVGLNEISLFPNIHCVCANGDAYRQMSALSDHVCFLPVGIDLVHYNPDGADFRDQLGLRDKVVFGYVGRIAHIKGTNELVNTFIKIAHNHSNVHLLVVGDGEMQAALEAQVRQVGMESRCHFVGNQQEALLPQWYRTMDIFILPSHYENFSNALLEAMACGLPVVASNVGGNQEVIEVGKNGWLFSQDLNGNFYQVLETCLEQYRDWPAMGEYSRLKAKQGYSWEKSTEIIEALLEQHFAS